MTSIADSIYVSGPSMDEKARGSTARLFYWERRVDDGAERKWRPPPGEDLSAMRRGLGEPPGASPALWPFYTTLEPNGDVTRRLWAEHLALGLYGLHQQSESLSVHIPKVRLGRALAELRQSNRFSEAAVDARVERAATAADLNELAHHLRGLVGMLKTLNPTRGFDYTRLYSDLWSWQDPVRVGGVRRRWGADYILRRNERDTTKENSRKDV